MHNTFLYKVNTGCYARNLYVHIGVTYFQATKKVLFCRLNYPVNIVSHAQVFI